MEKTMRAYAGSDSYMIQQSGVIKELVKAALPPFAAFDSTIDNTFILNFEAAIEAALTTLPDDVIIDQQAQKSDLVKVAMADGRDKYQDIMVFVTRKAFKNNRSVWNEFGYNDYEKDSRGQARFFKFMTIFHKVAVSYNAELLAAGCSQAAIDEIDTIAKAIGGQDQNQELFKRGRPVLSKERIKLLNNCYEYTILCIALAQRVYKNDYERRKQFVYNPSEAGESDDLFEGTLAPSENRVVVEGGRITSATSLITVENPGNTNLKIAIAATPGTPPADAVELAPGTSFSFAGSTLANLPQYLLIIQNLSITEAGEYRVEIED